MPTYYHHLAIVALLALAPPAGAADIVGLGAELPRVQFDVPGAVTATEVASASGDRLVRIELPVSVVVAKGDVHRVAEVVLQVDGEAAGLTVHDFSPATTLTTEYAGDIEVRTSTESDRHVDGSLGGILPNPGSAVAQLTPSLSAGVSGRDTETETLKRLPPKDAIVVAGATNRRRGVLFKFRPSSQTTLEGEHRLTITFAAPDDWHGGQVTVRCHARGEHRVLFVKQRKVWGSAEAPVEVHPTGSPTAFTAAHTATHTAAKPVVDPFDAPAPPTASLWKARQPASTP